MKDRFKFRTYNPDLKCFTYWGWMNKGEYKNMCSCREISKDELLEKYTQQCTGLKDKNGKLIYEGDIVRYICPAEYCSDGLHKCQDCYTDEVASIHFDEEQAMFIYRSEIDQCSLTDNINPENDLEVIGNIYKNPELLKEQD